MKRLLIGFAFAAVLAWPQKEAPVASEMDRARQKMKKLERPVKGESLDGSIAGELEIARQKLMELDADHPIKMKVLDGPIAEELELARQKLMELDADHPIKTKMLDGPIAAEMDMARQKLMELEVENPIKMRALDAPLAAEMDMARQKLKQLHVDGPIKMSALDGPMALQMNMARQKLHELQADHPIKMKELDASMALQMELAQEKLEELQIEHLDVDVQMHKLHATEMLLAMQGPAPPAAPSPAAAPAPPSRESERSARAMGIAFAQAARGVGGNSDEDKLYRNGKSALEEREWERSAEYFQRIIDRKGTRTEAALYWKAYALNRLGRKSEAVAMLAELVRSYPQSRWLDDAKALELEVKQSTGQSVSPDSEADEDLKLLALNGMIHTDPERSIPAVENLLAKSSSPRLKDRALFVLAQSKSPKSREVLLKMARGATNPDLQYKAVEYVGFQSTPEIRQVLQEIYVGSSDVHLKRAVLRSYLNSRDKERLLAAARVEQTPELRREAIRGLGSLDANDEIWQLYKTESSSEMKMELLRALPGKKDNVDRLLEAAKSEKDPKIRRELIMQVGYTRAQGTSDVLAGLYRNESDQGVKRGILESLRNQNSAKALIEIAKSESDLKMKRTAVEMLSNMKSKEATDYLLEMLK